MSSSISVPDLVPSLAVLLVVPRVVGLAWTAPTLAIPEAGWRTRVVLAVILAGLLAPIVEREILASSDWRMLGWALAAELGIGAALGASAALIVAGARQAGEIVAAQAGLAPAALFDPDADLGGELTALGQLYAMLAVAVFLALDGPVVLVGAVVESYHVLPWGRLELSEATATGVFSHLASALALAVRASAPPALALALAGLALGLIARTAPSIQLAALALPVRWAVGMVIVGLSLVTLAATLASGWQAWPGW